MNLENNKSVIYLKWDTAFTILGLIYFKVKDFLEPQVFQHQVNIIQTPFIFA